MLTNKQMLNEIVSLIKSKEDFSHIKSLIDEYIKNGFNINSFGTRGKTLAHYAVRYNYEGMITYLNNLNINLNLCNDYFETPLISAIKLQRTSIINELLKCNIDVNLPGEFDATPLHFATINGDINVIKLLIASGADVNQVDEKNLTPLDYAIDENNDELIEFYKNYKGE